jgi:Type I phosphodiesterase / nucleotide pyrophosphatase
VVAVLLCAPVACRAGQASQSAAERLAAKPRTYATNDVVERACALGPKLLLRIYRGYYRHRSEDLTMVPQAPNYPGGLDLPSHSGPWTYLQQVPLVLYGPGHVRATRPQVTRHASITDVYPTVGRLTGVELSRRPGRALHEALGAGGGPPKLVLTVVWDGAGRNVLRRWPRAWPNLRRLQHRGTSYLDATVGSSPSITPATHSSLGTGAFPRQHGITAIAYRGADGRMANAFGGKDPRDLELATFADQIDLALGNAPVVGMLGWRAWQIGMLGHGRELPGGDADELVLINSQGDLRSNPSLYSMPATYATGFAGLRRRAAELDRADGKVDGRWLGHDILAQHDNPAWVSYESDVLLDMLERGGYGDDATPDLFFTNFKMTDIVGHQYTMDSPEMAGVLRAQDRALGRIVRYLDRTVGDYVVIVTADHGHVPSPERTGGWALGTGEVRADVDERFGAVPGRSLTLGSASTGLFFDYERMRALGVSDVDVARFLNSYTIAENWRGKTLPQGYQERADEQVLAASIPRSAVPDVMRCAFGAPRPPRGLDD